jgi:hypothetical protein
MELSLCTVLDASAERVWGEARTSRLLHYVAAPWVTFEPITPLRLPEIWQEGSYLVRMRFLGVLPIGKQWIVISYPEPDAGPRHYLLKDEGRGDLASSWRHLMTIRPRADGCCNYCDHVNVQAGFVTWLVWAFAWVFYRHRQYRWRRLVAHGFDHGT